MIKTFSLLGLLLVCELAALSQEVKVIILNDTTELQEYTNGEKLKVNYRLNGKIITIKGKDKLLAEYPGIQQEFNIKSSGSELIGEINFTDESISFPIVNKTAIVTPPTTLDISKDLKGKPFPDFSWIDVEGNKFSLQQLKGKSIVLNFWHTSCVPCIAEMPLLNKLVKKYEGRDVIFISVSPNSSAELQGFFRSRTFDYIKVASVDTRSVFSPFPGWPIHIIIDGNGVIQFSALGKQEKIEEKLIDSLEQVLGSK